VADVGTNANTKSIYLKFKTLPHTNIKYIPKSKAVE
jgi:hypothetical protein